MNDTPDHIKQIQHRIWMQKPPMERLKQFLMDNDDFFRVTNSLKNQIKAEEALKKEFDNDITSDKFPSLP
jgi:hypothetical protein